MMVDDDDCVTMIVKVGKYSCAVGARDVTSRISHIRSENELGWKVIRTVKSVATSSVAMKWKEWQRSWSLQDLLCLVGKEFNRWIYEEFWVGFGMNPTHAAEINWKSCNLDKNFLDNCKRLTEVSSYNLQFVIK